MNTELKITTMFRKLILQNFDNYSELMKNQHKFEEKNSTTNSSNLIMDMEFKIATIFEKYYGIRIVTANLIKPKYLQAPLSTRNRGVMEV